MILIYGHDSFYFEDQKARYVYLWSTYTLVVSVFSDFFYMFYDIVSWVKQIFIYFANIG